ncbi:MAG TPA: transcriptional repressor NrdR [Clostridiales bacterium]|nr:transcriptional repressor NrdR [Clostridiales bacterium]
MKCPFCGYTESKVVDSRATDDNNSIRRRRECLECKKRFTTYENIETTPILVIKNGGNRQPFNPEKIKLGIIKACEKRPVPRQKIDELVEGIVKKINNSMLKEVPSSQIGEMVMQELKEIDEVAYVRFASVYRKFKDINTFMDFIEESELKK